MNVYLQSNYALHNYSLCSLWYTTASNYMCTLQLVKLQSTTVDLPYCHGIMETLAILQAQVQQNSRILTYSAAYTGISEICSKYNSNMVMITSTEVAY